MAITARLCNPTHEKVEWPWHRGEVLIVQPFGFVDLPAKMMEQLLPDEAGYDSIKSTMDHYGVFLRDTGRTYESQALEAINAAIKTKNQFYNDCVSNIRERAAHAGNINEEAIAHKLEAAGYTRLARTVDELRKIKATLEAKESKTRQRHTQYDPERTLLFTNPPMEFESPTAMQLYLSYNDDMRQRYTEFMKQFKAKTASAEKAAQE